MLANNKLGAGCSLFVSFHGVCTHSKQKGIGWNKSSEIFCFVLTPSCVGQKVRS